MSSSGFLSSLNLITLIGVLAVAVVAFWLFMRKRSNRHPMEHRQERNVAEDLDAHRDAPDHSRRS